MKIKEKRTKKEKYDYRNWQKKKKYEYHSLKIVPLVDDWVVTTSVF